jgi:AcrR family transcriptional regulator
MARADRRGVLLDAAAALVKADGIDALSMEAVADKAGVSRPLLYKHFANRGEVLTELYRRETTEVHEELSRAVIAAATVLDAYRALVQGSLAAAAVHGSAFAALRSAGVSNSVLRKEQRSRDGVTARYFARRAVRELSIDEERALPATALLLSMIDDVLAQWRRRPTAERAAALEETFMTIVSAALDRLGEHPAPPQRPGSRR